MPIPILVYNVAVTTKSPKTLWWWVTMIGLCLENSSISAWCPDKQLQLSEYMSQVELYNHSLACGRCRLPSDWYCIGYQNNGKYPPIPILPNTSDGSEYCPGPNTSIVLILGVLSQTPVYFLSNTVVLIMVFCCSHWAVWLMLSTRQTRPSVWRWITTTLSSSTNISKTSHLCSTIIGLVRSDVL